MKLWINAFAQALGIVVQPAIGELPLPESARIYVHMAVQLFCATVAIRAHFSNTDGTNQRAAYEPKDPK